MPQPSTEEGCRALLRIQELVATVADQIPEASHASASHIQHHQPMGAKDQLINGMGKPPTTRASPELHP